MRRIVVVLGVLSYVAVISALFLWNPAVCSTPEDVKQEEVEDVQRLPVSLGEMFNFEQFKLMFNKHYNSLIEELVRRKIYLGRAFHAFISKVKYRHFQSSHYLSVNPRSDQTPEERKRHRHRALEDRKEVENLETVSIKGPQVNWKEVKSGETVEKEDSLDNLANIPVAEPEDIELELNEIVQNKDQPGWKEIADELTHEIISKKKRPSNSYTVGASEPGLSDDTSMTEEGDRVLSNNPDYKPHPPPNMEEEKEAALSKRKSKFVIAMDVAQSILNQPGVNYVKNLVYKTVEEDKEAGRAGERRTKSSIRNKVHSDLRETGCLRPPAEQGDCGSCYAFAAITMYEYVYCTYTEHLVPFSIQYMVSCGDRARMFMCEGAYVLNALLFVDHYGLELEQDYPYLAVNGTCPYREDTSRFRMGYIKAKNSESATLTFEGFDDYLKKRPILIAIDVPDEFDDYGNGVFNLMKCVEENSHAMLIVGHGQEDGKEYYLIRNSYGPKWGTEGHIKYSKEAVHYCASHDHGFITLAKFSRRDLAKKGKYRTINATPIA